jgi:predicted RNA methylase
MLITHRNLNFIATVVATGMAIWRIDEGKPSAGYFVAGAAGICILAYTAYLGGKLVYGVGVGVDPAHGVYRADAPALKSGQIVSFIKAAATDLLHGVQHMVEEVAKGRLIPTIMGSPRKQPEGPDAPMAGEPK